MILPQLIPQDHLPIELRKMRQRSFPTRLNWPFKNKLYFIHRNQKQNSRQSIAHYRAHETRADFIQEISAITQDMINATSAEEFSALMTLHETNYCPNNSDEARQGRIVW